ncbi:hypothetical protein LO772_22610 [Yinghuangia sp. ASG 101]|uniref:plasmid mobilization protein n=1 Tax=Yinghuangia sp. ASG 101 TaxID=2896848 RepID=UPI001E3EA163|nr:hypothetical protein [Yinghuangia sp. ASG 101]UGQ09697.1 hypothetical protein LO772_22610 [Yinghuangia sp. ASG 101]
MTREASATGGTGRLRRHTGGRRHVAKVKMNDAEHDLVRERAASLGVSVPRLLVEAGSAADVVTATERHALYAELLALRRLLAELARTPRSAAPTPGGDEDRAIADACRRVEEVLAGLASPLGLTAPDVP